MQEFPLSTEKDSALSPIHVLFFWFSGVYNEATNEIVTGGVGNVTVSTHLRLVFTTTNE